jgi:hypothetical protein
MMRQYNRCCATGTLKTTERLVEDLWFLLAVALKGIRSMSRYTDSLGNEQKRAGRRGRGATHLVRGALLALTAVALTSCQGSVTDLSLSDGAGLVITPLVSPNLAGTVGNTTDERVRLQVADDQGRPVSGVSVEFRVVSEDGSVTPTFVRSNAHGIVEADWVLGQRAGDHALEVVGVSSRRPQDRVTVRVPARARPSEPQAIVMTPEEVSVKVGQTWNFIAEVKDQYGNTLEGASLIWNVKDSNVATLASGGTVIGVAPGSTEIEVSLMEASFAAASPGNGRGGGQGGGNNGGNQDDGSEDGEDDGGNRPIRGNARLKVEPVEDEQPVEEEAPVPAPATIADLAVASVTDSSVVLRFTQVEDGTGKAASYAVRYGSPDFSMGWDAQVSTERHFAGSQVGSILEVPYAGLLSDTDYAFRVAAVRESLDGERVYGDYTQSVSARTAAVVQPPAPEDEKEEEIYSISISPTSLELEGVGSTGQLSATLTDGNGSEVQGSSLNWTTSDADVATVSADGLVTARAVGTALVTVSAACCGSSDTISVIIVQEQELTAAPETVTDLQVVETNGTSVVLAFTEVDDGTGNPARYAIRHQTPNLVWWQAFETEETVLGQQVGQTLQVLRNSLSEETTYEFQLVSYRGELNVDATFGELSNVAAATTVAAVEEPEVQEPTEPSEPFDPGNVVFFDDFESGTMEGGNGFSWGRNNRTSVVRDDGCAVWNNGAIMNCGQSDNWENGPGVDGRHALRFRYAAGQNMSEQRFTLPEAMDEVWISYWIRVPVNFSHPGGNNNQKFFALWQDDYEFSGSGATATFQFRASGDGSRVANYQILPGSGSSTARHTGESGSAMLWTTADRGRWLKVVIHARNGTNGLVEQWSRWEGESNWTQLYSANQNLGSAGWRSGYIMGWANAPYSQDTEFLIDDFTVSATSLLD